ncbi:glycosyltransferase family 15 protein, partial [[Candida] arabinofermentans NRRL YB-2248]
PVARENATLISLVRNSELFAMLRTINNVENRFNHQYHYDWIFANDEPFTTEFMDMVSNMCSGTVKFVQIPYEMWSYPDWIDQEKAAEVRKQMRKKRVKYGDKEAYRHMCRFFSGMFYNLEEMKNYKYFWRIEPDVEFRCSIRYDPFKVMREGKKTYGFNLAPLELHTTVRSLWNETINYMSQYPDKIADNNNFKFLTDDDGVSFNMCHFWSNFEIADLDFFRGEAYTHFFDYLDQKGGIYYERWGDAPIHSIAVSILLPYTQLQYFTNTGYYHAPNMQCDGSPQMIIDNECTCSPTDDFAWDTHSCIPKFFDIHNLERPDYAPKTRYLPIH